MNQQELVDAVAKKVGKPKTQVEKILRLSLEAIQEKVAAGENVTLSGFGTFLLRRRKAGQGFNPHTKETMALKEVRTAYFRPGKGFKGKLS